MKAGLGLSGGTRDGSAGTLPGDVCDYNHGYDHEFRT